MVQPSARSMELSCYSPIIGLQERAHLRFQQTIKRKGNRPQLQMKALKNLPKTTIFNDSLTSTARLTQVGK